MLKVRSWNKSFFFSNEKTHSVTFYQQTFGRCRLCVGEVLNVLSLNFKCLLDDNLMIMANKTEETMLAFHYFASFQCFNLKKWNYQFNLNGLFNTLVSEL
jgi:hypothetical protein